MPSVQAQLEKLAAMSPEERAKMAYLREAERRAQDEWYADADLRQDRTRQWERENEVP